MCASRLGLGLSSVQDLYYTIRNQYFELACHSDFDLSSPAPAHESLVTEWLYYDHQQHIFNSPTVIVFPLNGYLSRLFERLQEALCR